MSYFPNTFESPAHAGLFLFFTRFIPIPAVFLHLQQQKHESLFVRDQ